MKKLLFALLVFALWMPGQFVAAQSPEAAQSDEAPSPDVNEESALTIRNPDQARWVFEEFLEHILEEDYEEAFDFLHEMPGMIRSEQLLTLRDTIMEQTSFIAEAYGSALDYTFVRSDILSSVLYRVMYAVRHERHLIRWVAVFYNPLDEGWYLNDLAYDDNIGAFFSN